MIRLRPGDGNVTTMSIPSLRTAACAASLLLCVALMGTAASAQALSGAALVSALQRGGYVLVMRHARSPQVPPTRQAADPGNTTLERQLDDAGREGAGAMGRALRALRVPLGEVATSPAFRARQTAELAGLTGAQVIVELGDNGQSMQGVTEAQGVWLRDRAGRPAASTNTLLITHSPNLARAFPDLGTVADGEVIIFGPAGRLAGRVRIEEWPGLVP